MVMPEGEEISEEEMNRQLAMIERRTSQVEAAKRIREAQALGLDADALEQIAQIEMGNAGGFN